MSCRGVRLLAQCTQDKFTTETNDVESKRVLCGPTSP